MRWTQKKIDIAKGLAKHRQPDGKIDYKSFEKEFPFVNRTIRGDVKKFLDIIDWDLQQIELNKPIKAKQKDEPEPTEDIEQDAKGESKPTDDPEQRKKGDSSPDEPKQSKEAKTTVAVTKEASDANYIVIKPKRVELTSQLFWLGKEAAINFWNWPSDISDEDFLDTFIYNAFKQRGIILGGIMVMNEQKEVANGSDKGGADAGANG